ncbi:MAG: hypothetical protein IK012_12310 [Fibrobacter sp.]|uniref:hypothetical protein n=1 Tax=Fibrobacter sp. TaxID=35828 RepID=UPI0025C21F1E|nr:hypothetical protein [Fibrobacter sp.]MBR4786014.1 hypothetical protein [Fibrobacter sp.]
MIFRILAIFACALALFYAACTNSDDFLYNEADATFIEVSAEMAYSFDSISERIKSDTLNPGDSLIFIANILPSKSIKIKRYLWTLDGDPFSFDFSFRSAVSEPGMHKIAFVLETFFGDTLSDTLTLWVSSPPILQDSMFIPANGSQGIPTTGGISFAWNAYDPDSIAILYYHFSIDGIIDTLLTEPNFTYWKDLEPLHHYLWHVQAINEFGFVSSTKIDGNFFTSGGPNEGGITGFIDVTTSDNNNVVNISAKISILDSIGYECYGNDVKANNQTVQPFVVSPLTPGNYKAIFSVPKYADFTSDTIDFTISSNEVVELGTIDLRDTVAPKISFIENGIANEEIDTLEYADTLKFLVTDFGTLLAQKTVYVYLESEKLTEKVGASDTLIVVLPSNAKSWNTRHLDIIAIDASKNRNLRSYTIEPADSWIKTNNSFTQNGPGSINLFVIDTNPYGFTIESCSFLVNGNLYHNGNLSTLLCSTTITTDDLVEGKNTIESIAEYSIGINHSKKWYITYTEAE